MRENLNNQLITKIILLVIKEKIVNKVNNQKKTEK